MCCTAGGPSSARRISGPHTPGRARGAGRIDTTETGKRHATEGAEFFNTCGGVLRERIPMRDRAIQEHDRRYPIRLMCRTLAVSPAGYYAWRSRLESHRAVSARTVLSAIQVIHQESRETYGSPQHLGRPAQAGTLRRRASRRAADASGRPPSQDGEEVACHHPVPASVPRGGEHPRSSVHGRVSESGLGPGPHLRVDHRRLALPRRHPRSLLASRDRLGDGPPSDRGSSRACPHDGAGEPETQGRAPAPLESRQSVCRHELSAITRHPRRHGKHESQR